jgi:hypothetical protein
MPQRPACDKAKDANHIQAMLLCDHLSARFAVPMAPMIY